MAYEVEVIKKIVRQFPTLVVFCDCNDVFAIQAEIRKELQKYAKEPDKVIVLRQALAYVNLLIVDKVFEDNFLLKRNGGADVTLADAICHGFLDGLDAVCLLPNNDVDFSIKEFHEQREKYRNNTCKIVRVILQAARNLGIPVNNAMYLENANQAVLETLCQRLARIEARINDIKKNKQDDR